MNALSLKHHATLLRGGEKRALELLEAHLGVAFSHTANADVTFTRVESFGIDDARSLAARAIQKPIVRSETYHIISAQAITLEAQNALLKLTEDPPPHARFIFVAPQSLPIIPTFRSRLEEVRIEEAVGEGDVFLGTIGEQLERVARMSKDNDSHAMEALLRQAEQEVSKASNSAGYGKAVIQARRYIETRGASAKMLLEHVVLARACAQSEK